MRSTYYIFGVVLTALVVLAAVFSRSAALPRKHRPTPRALVYVDPARLVKLHPGSPVLARMKSLAGEIDGGSSTAARSRNASAAFKPLANVIEPPSVSRQEIEAEIAQSAAIALSKLESDEMQALHARITASRATMMENARSEMVVRVREIDRTAAFKERSLIAQLGPDRLTAQIRASVLQNSVDAMSKATKTKPESAKPGDTLKTLLSDLQMTDMELKKINDTLASESVGIKAGALEETTKLRQASRADIEAKLSVTENTERAKIESGISAARGEILDELSSSDQVTGLVLSSVTDRTARALVSVTPRSPRLLSAPGSEGEGTVRERIAAMEARIRADVGRAVRALAEREQVRVTFVRPKASVPDATARFAAKLKAGGASVWGPVMAAGSGSDGASPSRVASPSRERG